MHGTPWIAVFMKKRPLRSCFGMIGTLIGLILMLGNMQDVNALASGMAVALITTLYGSLLANIVCLPVASKLKARHEEEFLCKQLVMEGVIAIQEGENPRYIEEKALQASAGPHETRKRGRRGLGRGKRHTQTFRQKKEE